jgi:transcriptional regulator with XRE-family HTH domain
MQIGDVLKQSRLGGSRPEGKKIGLVELSKLSGISFGQIARIEKNQSIPTIHTLVKICNALGLTLQQILLELGLESLANSSWVFPRTYVLPFRLGAAQFIELLATENKKEFIKATGQNSPWTHSFAFHYNEEKDMVEYPYVPGKPSDEEAYGAFTSRHLYRLIADEYFSGHIIIGQDLDAYLGAWREDRGISRAEMSRVLDVEYHVIERIETSQTRLFDWNFCMKLEEKLNMAGAAIALAWAVAEFNTGLFLKQFFSGKIEDYWREDKKAFLSNLIVFSRLDAASNITNTAIPEDLLPRKKIENYGQTTRKSINLLELPVDTPKKTN